MKQVKGMRTKLTPKASAAGGELNLFCYFRHLPIYEYYEERDVK